jgi:uncharacterized protein DUF1761
VVLAPGAGRILGAAGLPLHRCTRRRDHERGEWTDGTFAWLGVIAVSAVAHGVTAEAVGADSASDGIVLGLVLGLGFGATLASWPPIFARMPWEWWLVNSGAFVLMQVAMGAIFGLWH